MRSCAPWSVFLRIVLVGALVAILGATAVVRAAPVRAHPSCVSVFDCHRDGHQCVVDGDDAATGTTRAALSVAGPPPLVRSPRDLPVQRVCVFTAEDATQQVGKSTRRRARPEDGVAVLLGHPEAALLAPLHSPRPLFFRNMSDTYCQWHPQHAAAFVIDGLAEQPEAAHRAPHDTQFDDAMEYDDGMRPDRLSADTARVTVRRLGLVYRFFFARASQRLWVLRDQWLHYPWRSLSAVERLFYRRVFRLEYRVASTVTTTDPSADIGTEEASTSDTEDANVDAGGDISGGLPSTSSLFSIGSLRGLRVVSFPPTPLAVASTPLRGTSPTPLTSLTSPRIVYTCDFRTVRAARQHLNEGHLFDSGSGVTGRDDDDVDENLARGLEALEYDLADVLEGGSGRSSRRGAGVRAARRQRFSLMTRLASRVLPAGLTGASSSLAKPPRSPSQVAAAAYLARVHEELGPFQSSQALLPRTMQQILGTRELATRQQLRITATTTDPSDTQDGSGNGRSGRRRRRRQTHYDFAFEASLPAARGMCLAVTLSPAADLARLQSASVGRATGDVDVQFAEALEFDWLWLKLFVAFRAFAWMRPRVQDSRLLRFVTAGLCGTFILCILLAMYVVRHLQQMSVGRLGLAVAVTMGGMAAFAEGLASVVQYALFSLQDQLTSEVWLYLGVVLVCVSVVSSLLVQWLFSAAVLQTGTRIGLHTIAGLTLFITFRRNREATVLVLLAQPLLRPRLVVRAWTWVAGFTCIDGDDESESGPAETVPDEAQRAQRYWTPLVAEARQYTAHEPVTDDTSHTAKSVHYRRKMQVYEEDGARHTREALAQLAAHLRANPHRYVDRLLDPNRAYQWARSVHPGASDDEDGELADSEGVHSSGPDEMESD